MVSVRGEGGGGFRAVRAIHKLEYKNKNLQTPNVARSRYQFENGLSHCEGNIDSGFGKLG